MLQGRRAPCPGCRWLMPCWAAACVCATPRHCCGSLSSPASSRVSARRPGVEEAVSAQPRVRMHPAKKDKRENDVRVDHEGAASHATMPRELMVQRSRRAHNRQGKETVLHSRRDCALTTSTTTSPMDWRASRSSISTSVDFAWAGMLASARDESPRSVTLAINGDISRHDDMKT